MRGYLGRLRSAGARGTLPRFLKIVEKTYNSQRVNPKSGLTPDETTDYAAPSLLQAFQSGQPSVAAPRFKVGDTVLLHRPKEIFGLKTDDPQFYSIVYRVFAIKLAIPRPRYILESLDGEKLSGAFAESQLRRVDITFNRRSSVIFPSRVSAPSTTARSRSPIITRGQTLFSRQV